MLLLPRLKPPPPPRLMLLEPPRLKPPPPRPPPPPPPRPPRASASWTTKAARLTNALSIATLEIMPRMSLSLERGQLDPLRVRVWNEGEVGIREGRVDLPLKPGAEARLRGIVPVDDYQLPRKRLVALLDPDLPIHVVLAEGEMIGRDTIQGHRADLVGGPQSLDSRGVRAIAAPSEQVLQRQGDAEFAVDRVEDFLVRARCGSAGVEAQLRRIDGEVLAVVNEAPALDVADIVDDEAWPPDL